MSDETKQERQRLFKKLEGIYMRDADVVEAFIDFMEEEFAVELKEANTPKWWE